MTTAEDIEKAVEQLPPRELARFRAWFEAFDAAQFDAGTSVPASLMGTRMRPLPRTAPGARATCEAFLFTEILDRLRGIAAPGSKAGRRQFWTPQTRSAPSIAAIEESRPLLVRPHRHALSCTRR